MVTIKKIVVTLIIIGFAVFEWSCECVVKPPCNGEFNFKIVDKFSHEDIIFGANARYNPDSIRFVATNDTIQPSSIQRSQNRLYCIISNPGDTLYLRLNATDIDTLILSYRNTKHTLCCPSGGKDVTGIRFNNVQSKQDSLVFIFEK